MIFQIKYNEWVSSFWIFQNQKLNKMTSNVNGTSIMIHMRLTACRLDTCATSGRCYTSDFQFAKSFFIYLLLYCLYRLNHFWIWWWWCPMMSHFRNWNICKLIDWYFWTFPKNFLRNDRNSLCLHKNDITFQWQRPL